MNSLYIVIHTANILGIFADPFEFEGDYGPEMNPIRQKVFELVISKEALSKNLSDSQVRALMQENNAFQHDVKDYRSFLVMQAINEEREYGPTLSQLVTPELIEEIKKKQVELQDIGFTSLDLEKILYFIGYYKDQKVFRFLRNCPADLLSLDKSLRDEASREGKTFNLPILGSTRPLRGQDSLELKKNLVEAIFTKETFALTKSPYLLKQSISKLDRQFLKDFFGAADNNQDLEAFISPSGQVFFYWMYQALNLHLISADPRMIEQINKVKDLFAHTLGDSAARAKAFKDKLMTSNSEVLFTQESDAAVAQTLTKDGLYLPIDRQNPKDGTFIFLRSDRWEPHYEIISIESYEGFESGRMTVILAARKESDQKFLLASCHGHSTKPEDGRLQISLVMKKFHELSNGSLHLLIGTDANTKTAEDVNNFKEHLDHLGLTATDVGPTTIKKEWLPHNM